MPIRKNKCFTQRFFRFSEFIFHSKWQRGGHLLTPANFSGLKSMASSGKSECERWRWKKCWRKDEVGSCSCFFFLWCSGRGSMAAVLFCVLVCETERLSKRRKRGQVAPLFHLYNPIQTHWHKCTCSSSSSAWTWPNPIAKIALACHLKICPATRHADRSQKCGV